VVQTSQRPAGPRQRLADLWPRLVHIYQREIWQTAFLRDRSFKGCAFAVLRVISITGTVFIESRVATRAAALSFSSILSVGPLIAIAVLVAGFALGQNDPKKRADTVAQALHQMITAIAPQIQQYEELTQTPTEVRPEVVEVLEQIISASQSGSAGALSLSSLLLIVLLLFKSIEDTFNDIWGVRQGRSVLTRIVFYWTILTLGAVLFFTSVALLGAGTFLTVFMEKLPGGSVLHSLGLVLPLFSFSLLTVMLTVFYRVIPNTHVAWRAAFIGALVVATLLVANNFLTFLYAKRVVQERSLYGGLALPLVVMSVFYIFWICVLTGGIVSYAIQNVHFRNSQAAWSTLPEATRERMALVVFLTICRRFRDCLPPISASHLSTLLKVPTQLLNECLNRLVQLKLITTLQADPRGESGDSLYQPARPLNRITLYDFKTLDDNFGENPLGASFDRIDPLIGHYDASLNKLGEVPFFQKTVDQLFDEHPFDESRPPFALGDHRKR
jgi:membrane protein